MSFTKALLRHFRPVKAPHTLIFAPSGTLILAEGPNASVAYLLAPYLARQGTRFELLRSDARTMQACHTLIIARYLPDAWIDALHDFKAAGGRLVYFMDDDLMDPAVTHGLPAGYRRKIARLATSHRMLLERLCDEFWVASPHLAKKYQSWSPILLRPQPLADDLSQASPVTVCYHGTASHAAEIRWLTGVMEEALGRCPNLHFELFGDLHVNRQFRLLPRVSILHPMDWSNYRDYTSAVRRDIALAPLLPHPFNAARGPTKFFDFARLGAAGMYSDTSPYSGFVRHEVDGLLLDNDPQTWAAAIVSLASDPMRRRQLSGNARQRALTLADDLTLVEHG